MTFVQRPKGNKGGNLCEYFRERILQKEVPLKNKVTEVAEATP